MKLLRNISVLFLLTLGLVAAGIVLTARAQTPEVPTGLTVTATSSCAFEVSWNYSTSTGIVFEGKRKVDVGGASLIYDGSLGLGVDEFNFIDSNNSCDNGCENIRWETIDGTYPIDPGTPYQYIIRAYNPSNGTWSETSGVSATTLSLPGKPGAAGSLEAEADSDSGNMALSWSLPGGSVSGLFPDYGGFVIEYATSVDGATYGSFSYLDRIYPWEIGGRFFYEHYSPAPDRDLSYKYRIYTQEVGGLGCDYNRNEHTVLSDPAEVIVPVRPDGFSGAFFPAGGGEVRRIELSWNDRSANEDGFSIERSLSPDSGFIEVYRAGSGVTSWTDTNVSQSTVTYYYRISAYKGGAYSFYADGSPIIVATGVLTPQNLKARVGYVDSQTGNASTTLTWEEQNVSPGSYLHIEESVNGGAFSEVASIGVGLLGRPGYYSLTRSLGDAVYEYRVYVQESGGAVSAYSNVSSVNLNIFYVLKGVAYSAHERNISGGGTGPAGTGWIKFNSTSENGSAASDVPYSVQFDSDGLFSGLAWAGEDYGWLSFSKEDLEGRSATIDVATGELSGWARFLNVPDGIDWDGWLSLSGTADSGGAYGVLMDMETGNFSGAAWGGGNVAGWTAFGSPESPSATVRAEIMVDTCDPGGLSATPVSPSEISLSWTNNDFECADAISLYRSPADNPGADRSLFTEVAEFSGLDFQISEGSVSYTDGGLEKNTSYGYFVRENVKGNESNIDSATTPEAKYSLYCSPRSSTEIDITWIGLELPEDYTLQLWGATSTVYETDVAQLNGDFGSGYGGYAHDELAQNTEYGYELRVFDGDDVRKYSIEPDGQPIYCTTEVTTPDEPDGVSVWALSSSTLHVTWRDNSATGHNFRLERIKLTPDDPDNLSAVPAGGGVQLNWDNPTNDNVYKGPFYHVIERADNSGFTGTVSSSTEPGSTSYSDSTTSFSFFDSQVTGGSDYYYRVKACSYIKSDFTRDGVTNPDHHCSDYSAVGMATAMKEKSGSWFGSIIKSIKSFFSSIREKAGSMIDNTKAFAAGIDLNTYFSQFARDLIFSENPGVYDDHDLDEDSVYLYRVKAVYDEGESSYSDPGSGKTLAGGETEITVEVNICTANSFCEATSTRSAVGGPPDQCDNNADCRGVGTSRKFFEETK